MMIKRSCMPFLLLVVSTLFMAACSQPDAYDFYDNNGEGVILKDDNGQWLVLNIWAQWCSSCREEIPELNALADSGVVRVLGFDFDNSQGKALERKIDNFGIQFPVVTSNPTMLLGTKMPSSLPATLIIDDQGQLVDVLYGPQTESGLKDKLQVLGMR